METVVWTLRHPASLWRPVTGQRQNSNQVPLLCFINHLKQSQWDTWRHRSGSILQPFSGVHSQLLLAVFLEGQRSYADDTRAPQTLEARPTVHACKKTAARKKSIHSHSWHKHKRFKSLTTNLWGNERTSETEWPRLSLGAVWYNVVLLAGLIQCHR